MKSAVEEFNTQKPVIAGSQSLVRKINEVTFLMSTLQRHTGGEEVWFRSFLILTLEEGGLNVTPRPL